MKCVAWNMRIFSFIREERKIFNTPLLFEHSRKTKSFLTSFGVPKVHEQQYIASQRQAHTQHTYAEPKHTALVCTRIHTTPHYKVECKKFEKEGKTKKNTTNEKKTHNTNSIQQNNNTKR